LRSSFPRVSIRHGQGIITLTLRLVDAARPRLIAQAKAKTPLQTIANQLNRTVTTIIRRTARLGLSIERVAKARK
jgi:hypothetical protein